MTKKYVIPYLLFLSMTSYGGDQKPIFQDGHTAAYSIVYLKCVDEKPTYFCRSDNASYKTCSREEAYKLAKKESIKVNSDEKLHFPSITIDNFKSAEKLICRGTYDRRI